MFTMPSTARQIWTRQTEVNQYVALRREFLLPTAQTGELLIATDTNFVVWVNGAEIGRGQYSDFPDRKSWTAFRVPLREGKNVLAVLAFHAGETFFTGLATAAGVQFALAAGDTVIVSDEQTRATAHTGYLAGPIPRRTFQVCFTSCFDARKFPIDWTMPEFDDAGWPAAVTGDDWSARIPRPVPVCVLGALQSGQRVKQGTLYRSGAVSGDNFALIMEADCYHYTDAPTVPTAPDNGCFAVYDLGGESVGFLEFEVTAPAGTVIDFSHGEHLDDGLVRGHIDERYFADRYVCHAGRNRYQLQFHRVGARFVQLNITNADGAVTLHYVGIRPWSFPLPPAAGFRSDDLLQQPLRRTAQRTLELCLHEHYEDCPWREQSMYAYDSRNQALYGYYLWGNYEFMRASFRLLGWSYPQRRDHLMMLCAPTEFARTIPIFSYVWLSAAYENFLYSGDRTLFEEFRPMIAEMVAAALAHYTPENGLYHTGTDPVQWNFYEWAPDLFEDGCRPDEFHAGYNFYLIEMLESYAKLLGPEVGREYTDRAAALRLAVDAYFWNPEKTAYASKKTAGQCHVEHHDHMQLLALYTGVATGDRADQVVNTLFAGRLNYATLSALPYLVRAMMPISAAARDYVARQIRTTYGAMLEKGATSLWETQTGGWDFDRAGSLCHGWSSLPIYYQSGAVLGVTPLTPGFRSFQVRPYADAWTHYATGTVPTPAGEIRVDWQRRADGLHLQIEHPAGLECVVADYPECPVQSVEIHERSGR